MKNVVFIFLASVLLTSCAKENSDAFYPYLNNPLNDTTWVEQPSNAASVNQLVDILSKATKADSFDISISTKKRFSEFLEITFPASFAKTLSGAAVTGVVKVEVIHLRTKGDFIRFARPTTSYGRLLETGGSFYIKATKDGQPLAMDPSKGITLHVRDANAVNTMKVFYGETNLVSPLPAGTNPSFTWVESLDSSRVNVVTRQDSSGIYRGYEMVSKRLNWVNLDYFIDSTQPRTSLTALLPANFTNANTTVFAVFKEQKVVVQLNSNFASKTFVAPNFPLNKKVILVSLSKIGDELFLSSKEVSIEANIRVNLTPESKTKAQIEQFLDAL